MNPTTAPLKTANMNPTPPPTPPLATPNKDVRIKISRIKLPQVHKSLTPTMALEFVPFPPEKCTG